MPTHDRSYDVTCLGLIVADVVAKPVDAFPGPGGLHLLDALEVHPGGNALNTAIACATLGLSTAMVGLVGDDAFGRYLQDAMRAAQLDTTGVFAHPSVSTSTSLVLVNTEGERGFLHLPGTNAIFAAEHIDFNIIAQSRFLHVAGVLLMPDFDGEPLAGILQRARAAGVTVSLDVAVDPTGRWDEVLAPAYRYMDYFFPNRPEAEAITGSTTPDDITQALIERGVTTVVLKDGANGCYIRTQGSFEHVPAYSVDAVDSTGAGDTFAAGFLSGLANGAALSDCARLANAVGAHCVQVVGATAGIASLDAIRAWMDALE